MKKFRFNLDSVLTMRRFQKNQASTALSEAQRNRNRLLRQLDQAVRSQTQLEESLVSCYKTSTKASDVEHVQSVLQYQRSRVLGVQEKLQAALVNEDECRQKVLLARIGEEAMLKLRAKDKESYLREQDREDELAVNEFVNARHHMRKVH